MPSFSHSDPFTLAWTILRSIQVAPDPNTEFVPPHDPVQLRAARAQHELHQILRAVTIFMDKHNFERSGSTALDKAVHSINTWKTSARSSRLLFAFRQWRLSNWVIDVQDAQKIWDEEIRTLEICAHALRPAQNGIAQLPAHQQEGLRLSCEIVQLQLTNRIAFDRKCLRNSEKLVALRQQIIAQENAKQALEVLQQWEAEI